MSDNAARVATTAIICLFLATCGVSENWRMVERARVEACRGPAH